MHRGCLDAAGSVAISGRRKLSLPKSRARRLFGRRISFAELIDADGGSFLQVSAQRNSLSGTRRLHPALIEMPPFSAFAICALLVGLSSWPTWSAAQPQEGWTTFTGEGGARVEYPSEVFAISQSRQRGRTFSTRDGGATLDVYTGPNRRGESPAQILRRTFPDRRSSLTYERVAHDFFAISAPHKGRVLYRRCNFYGLTIHCIDLTYPLREKVRWDAAVTRISRSLATADR